MRTHFEAWVHAWRMIGIAHALGMYASSEAIRRAHVDALIYGTGAIRIANGRAERVDPLDIIIDEGAPPDPHRLLRYANLQVKTPLAAYDGPGIAAELGRVKWP